MRAGRAAWVAAFALAACSGHSSSATSTGDTDDAASMPDDASQVLAAGSVCAAVTRGAAPASGKVAPDDAISNLKGVGELAAWLNGAELSGAPSGPEPEDLDAARQRGAAVFAAHCIECHGPSGDGKGVRANELTVKPRNFTTGVYALRSTESGSLPQDEDLFRTISRGIHGTAMPPWLLLPEKDRWALVAYLKTLSPDFADDEAPPPEPVGTPPASTPELLAKGKALFGSAGCASCHGADAKGDGPAAGALRDAAGNPVRPRDLTGSHYWRGSSVADIYQTVRTGLDGTPMASFARVMSSDDTWAVAAYVHSIAPKFEAGPDGIRCPDVATPHDPEELTGVRIVMHTIRRDQATAKR
jgi:mono/diheme cytochrome c family protein